MKDNPVTDFNYPGDFNKPDIVQVLKDLRMRFIKNAEQDEERAKSPDWEWRAIHVCSKEIAEIMLDENTPPDIKHRLSLMTYTGHQWVYVGKDEESDR